MFYRSSIAAAALALASAGTAFALNFPDVPGSNPHAGAIAELSAKGVIKGNPDGTFQPDRTVNRAELLTMLYRATGQTPSASSKNCFADVVAGSWYENVVCDAAAKGYVAGYADGMFRPERTVNRVEALKMSLLATKQSVPLGAAAVVSAYIDVPANSWFAPYVAAALRMAMLPIPGIDGSLLQPDAPLTRAEAASLIVGSATVEVPAASQSSATAAASSEASQRSQNAEEESSAAPSPSLIDVNFPFTRSIQQQGNEEVTFRFTLDAAAVGKISVKQNAGTDSSFTCRLYLLDSAGYSTQYYLGYADDSGCYLRTAMAPGTYQLQVRGSQNDASFTVAATAETGDGNDGFSQAKKLSKNMPLTGTLDGGDIADYYTFSVATKQNLTIQLTDPLMVSCTVYPLADVDLFGFDIPSCNEEFLFTTGSYVVEVQRKLGSQAGKKTYLIHLH